MVENLLPLIALGTLSTLGTLSGWRIALDRRLGVDGIVTGLAVLDLDGLLIVQRELSNTGGKVTI